MADSKILRPIGMRTVPITYNTDVSAQVSDLCACTISGDVVTLTLSVLVTKSQTTTAWYNIAKIPNECQPNCNIYIPWHTFNAAEFKGTVLITYGGYVEISNQEALSNQILRFTATWVRRES